MFLLYSVLGIWITIVQLDQAVWGVVILRPWAFGAHQATQHYWHNVVESRSWSCCTESVEMLWKLEKQNVMAQEVEKRYVGRWSGQVNKDDGGSCGVVGVAEWLVQRETDCEIWWKLQTKKRRTQSWSGCIDGRDRRWIVGTKACVDGVLGVRGGAQCCELRMIWGGSGWVGGFICLVIWLGDGVWLLGQHGGALGCCLADLCIWFRHSVSLTRVDLCMEFDTQWVWLD